MRTLPAATMDFSKEQLLIRMKLYGIFRPKYTWKTKTSILKAILLFENINTRSIEDGESE